jgi:hypothetical protein
MTVQPGVFNGFTIFIGGTFNTSVIWTAGGLLVDLSDYTAAMQVRAAPDSEDVITEFSTEDGSIVIDGPEGKLTLIKTIEQTENLPPGLYVYDLRLTNPDETITDFLLQGRFKIQQMVTQWPST